ncbi:hypothetical protein JTB14_034219 [Gonioctena quinquepunctata]|nr:hypothetical protein JTB14_034219 [Gonioctena quinquepunctata]
MPPLFVFPRARAKPELLNDTPPGSTAHYRPSRWRQTDIFVVPIPHSEKKLNLNDRRSGRTAVLTSTPYKEELEESICRRLTKDPKLNFGDTEKAAHIVKLNKRSKINDNEMTTKKDMKAKDPKNEISVREKNKSILRVKKIKKKDIERK